MVPVQMTLEGQFVVSSCVCNSAIFISLPGKETNFRLIAVATSVSPDTCTEVCTVHNIDI